MGLSWREGKGGNGAKSQNATEQTHVVDPAMEAVASAMPSMIPTVSVDAPSAVTGKSAAARGSGELPGLLQTSVANCLGSPRSSKSSRLG
jgi:hypothetical protein